MQRGLGFVIQSSAETGSFALSRIFIDEVGLAGVFALFSLSWPRLTSVGFAFTALLYLASEHHMAIQGVYLRPRNLLDERIFRPELTSCYVSSISLPFVAATLVIASLSVWFAYRSWGRATYSLSTLTRRLVSVTGGVVGLGYTCMASFGPGAIFMISLWHQIVSSGALSQFQPVVGPFTPYSAYPSLPSDRPPRPTTSLPKMNVIVIHIESLGDVSGRVGGIPVMTSLQRLAKTGVTWNNAYGVAPYSSRAIVATQSGRYPPSSRDNPFGLLRSAEYDCLANNFKRSAYRTAYFTADNFSFYGSDRLKQICSYDVMRDAKTYESLEPGYRNSLGADERALFTNAYEWIVSGDQSFFLTLQTLLPHYPYRTPPAWDSPRSLGGLRGYHDAISYVDHNLNLFLDKLQERGLLDSTLIVVMGDHGEAFEQHPKNRIHSAFVFEENMRIPLIISNPRLFSASYASDNMASLVDIAATVYDLTGVSDESPLHDGESLFKPRDRRMIFEGSVHRLP